MENPKLANLVIIGRVSGTPKGKGSMRPLRRSSDGRTVLVNPAGTVAWERTCRLFFQQEVSREKANGAEFPIEGPVEVDVVFHFRRPAGHYKRGGTSRKLKPSAPRANTKRPDLDKLVRVILDAMTGLVYFDDAQVIRIRAAKRYDEPTEEGVSVIVIADTDDPEVNSGQ